MSKTVWLWSDQHFGHANTFLKFKQADGVTPLRPFSSIEEMDDVQNVFHNLKISDEALAALEEE